MLVKFALRIPFVYVLAASLQLVAAFLLLSIAGNLLSVLVPYRIEGPTIPLTQCLPAKIIQLVARSKFT